MGKKTGNENYNYNSCLKPTTLFIACFLSFAAVIVVTGSVSQGIIRIRQRKKQKEEKGETEDGRK